MNDKLPRMDYRQHRRARRLVHECCNYDGGNCLLLDDGEPCVCVQSISLSLMEKTQKEQAELKARVEEGRKKLADEIRLACDARQWVEAIQEYSDITELDAATLNRLIKEIVVHESIDSDKTRHISIEIHFNLKPLPEVEQVTA